MSSGDSQLPRIINDLRRESIRVELLGLADMQEPGQGDCDAVLVWMAPSASPSLYQISVSWCRQNWPRAGLIGWMPAGEADDCVVALEAGFDDFVAGNNSIRELACRIHALSRRLQEAFSRRRSRGRQLPVEVELLAGEATVDGQRVSLTAMEAGVLHALVEASGAALSRRDLLDRVWGDGRIEVGERAVDGVVLRLRRKLGDASIVETLRGVGFRIRSDE